MANNPSTKALDSGKVIKVGWIHNKSYQTDAQGGGTHDVSFTGRETFDEVQRLLIDKFHPPYLYKVIGVKIGKSGDVSIENFGTGMHSLGDYCKTNKLFFSRIKIYLVTEMKPGRCTCDSEFPDLTITFLRGNMTCYDSESVRSHVALCDPSARSDGEFNPLTEGFTIKELVRCRKCKDKYIEWIAADDNTVTFRYSEQISREPLFLTSGFHNGKCLVVIPRNHSKKPKISWYRNGQLCKEGEGLFMIWPEDEGLYYALCGGHMSPHYTFKTLTSSKGRAKTSKKRLSKEKIEEGGKKAKSGVALSANDVSYDNKDEIGSGCFGTVYKAQMNGNTVAYKLCRIPARNKMKAVNNIIENEVKIHASLRHGNIIRFIGYIVTPKGIGLVSEYLENNLEDILFDCKEDATTKMLSTQTKRSIFTKSLQGLVYLHENNIVHADIKPANILVSSDFTEVKLCDMGLSRIKVSISATVTKSSVAGTPMYMAPESLLNHIRPNASSDCWSICATACEVFTGKDFWDLNQDEDDPAHVVAQLMARKKRPDAVRVLKNDFKSDYIVINKGLDYNPKKRPSAAEMLEQTKMVK